MGGFRASTGATRSLDRLTQAFSSGAGTGWHEHHPDVFLGIERSFRPGYVDQLTSAFGLPRVERTLALAAEAGSTRAREAARTVFDVVHEPRP